MARRSVLRASDADREQVAERLRNAAAEGRILAEELEHRLGEAFSARTYGELDAVVADLPRGRMSLQRRTAVTRLRALPTFALMLAVPLALALAAALILVIATLFAAWAIIIALGWMFLGHRARTLRGPWVIARRGGRLSRANRRAVGGFTPWL